jgi:hypothetical protein
LRFEARAGREQRPLQPAIKGPLADQSRWSPAIAEKGRCGATSKSFHLTPITPEL